MRNAYFRKSQIARLTMPIYAFCSRQLHGYTINVMVRIPVGVAHRIMYCEVNAQKRYAEAKIISQIFKKLYSMAR